MPPDEDIGGRNIVVDEPEWLALGIGQRMRVSEPCADLQRNINGNPKGKYRIIGAQLLHDRFKVESLDVFHDDEEGIRRLADVVNAHDVVVFELKSEPRFVDEHLLEELALLLDQFGQNALDGDFASQSTYGVHPSQKDFRHTTASERADEFKSLFLCHKTSLPSYSMHANQSRAPCIVTYC